MSDIINFNGTIEGLGGPFIGYTSFQRIFLVYYRKGIKYSVEDGVDDAGMVKYKTLELLRESEITDKTPISRIETRFVRTGQAPVVKTEKTKDADGKETTKEYLEATPSWGNSVINNAKWIPLGMGNTLAQYTDSLMQSIGGDFWNMLPFSMKPIIVKSEQKAVSAYITKNKRVLDDSDNSLSKETAYTSVSKRSDTLSVTFFTVKSNLILELLLKWLDTWMDSQKENQSLDSAIADGETLVFPEYKGYPKEDTQWDRSNSKYFIRRRYLDKSPPSYLFSYFSDSIFLKRAKLAGYSVNPSETGDGVTVTIDLEKIVSEEEAYIYEVTKADKKKKKKDEDEVNIGGKNSILDPLSDGGNMCLIEKKSVNGLFTPFPTPLKMTMIKK